MNRLFFSFRSSRQELLAEDSTPEVRVSRRRMAEEGSHLPEEVGAFCSIIFRHRTIIKIEVQSFKNLDQTFNSLLFQTKFASE